MARFIPIIIGTGRKGNQSSKVANLILKKMQDAGIETEIVNPSEYLLNFYTERLGKERALDEKGQKYRDLILKSESIVVVTPEYNRSYPGELKLLVDLLYSEYKGKKFFIVGVSDGPIGGARAVDALSHVVVGVEGVPVKPNLFFSNVLDVFDENGGLVDENFTSRIDKFISSL